MSGDAYVVAEEATVDGLAAVREQLADLRNQRTALNDRIRGCVADEYELARAARIFAEARRKRGES